MSGVVEILLGKDLQQSTDPSTYTDALLLSLGNMSEINLDNLTNKTQNDSLNYLINDLKSTSLVYTIILGFVCAFLCFLTVTGNLLVLITFRRMQTVGNLFILSLATADLIVGCFVMPLAGIYAIMEKWKMGLVLCKIWMSVDFTASTASIFNLLTLSLDRYWSITSPLQYLGKRTRARALLLIGFAWGLSLLWVIPIFSWHRFNNNERHIEPDKCEPEYTHSKVFKVSTAVLNFYLPLLVLISLNGRIYYEIKRRYKNVLLHRHASTMNESIVNGSNHTNHLYSHKLHQRRKHSSSPITVTLCDSDRQLYCSTINYGENEEFISKILAKYPNNHTNNTNISNNNNNNNNNESVLRINFKEKKNRPSVPAQIVEHQKPLLKRTYSYIDKNPCTQDELSWYSHRREHSHTSYTPISPQILSNYTYPHTRAHHIHMSEHSSKHSDEYETTRIDSIKLKNKRHLSRSSSYYNHKNSHHHYQTSPNNRTQSHDHDSLSDSLKMTPPSSSMHVFNLCCCCSAATSAITIRSNSFLNQRKNSHVESFHKSRQISSSSTSSVAPPSVTRKGQHSQSMTSLKRTTNSAVSHDLIPHSMSQYHQYRTSNNAKQSTVWNQQEKAFRQLFAIVFGFTCCFLPYFILYMVVAFCGSCVSERVVTATIWLGYVNSTINPFLYALSNKHFRRTFNRLLKRNNRSQSFYN